MSVGKGKGTPGRMPGKNMESKGKIQGREANPSRAEHENLFEAGTSRLETFERSGVTKDIDEAIELITRALEATPKGHPSLSERHGSLGMAYTGRYQRLGQVDDLEKSIKHKHQALAMASDRDPVLPFWYGSLGLSYGNRYQRLGQVDDIEKSIDYQYRALALTPNGHPGLPDRHTGLGVAYTRRYQHMGQVDDLETSIKHNSLALTLTPNDHPLFPDRHAHLGASYGARYKRLGQVEDIKKATEHCIRALASTPKDDPYLSERHANLGVSYGELYQRLGQLSALKKSIEHDSQALALTPDDHRSLPDRHTNLGASYDTRYRRLGQVVDLEKSTEHHTRALALTPDGHPDLPARHSNLGMAYGELYQLLGRVDDLEKSTEYFAHALALTPDGHPDLSIRYNSLGVSYGDRFQRLGQVDDLEKSIENYTHALVLTPEGHPDLPDRHANVGVSYSNRFRLLGQAEDLERSTEHYNRALELTPDDHPDMPERHADLGTSYQNRYRHLGQVEDLENFIKHCARALAMTPDGHRDLPERHANLGMAYEDRYRRLRQVDDLEKATEHCTRSVALTAKNHPKLPTRHLNQGTVFSLQYHRTRDASYLAHTLTSFRNASRILTGSPRDSFRNALYWANLASKISSLNPIEAYQATIDLLPQFVWLGATTHQRYQDLATAENLAISAAYAAILISDHRLALEWLEHARCVVWNQTLMLRSPTHELQASHPDLAARLQTIGAKLRDAVSISPESQATSSNSVDWEKVGKQRRGLAKEYEDLLAEARTLPGFGDFLRPMKADQIVQAARNGPIAVINCHEQRCDALIILPGRDDVRHLPLPRFTQGKAKNASLQLETCLRNKGIRARGFKLRKELTDNDMIAKVLLTLWSDVVKPVLEFFGYMNGASAESLPHITWCPTGALSFLPLHAAGDYDQPGSRVYNYAVSSYVPTLTSLFTLTPSLSDRTPRVLAIGQQYTAGHSPLPGTVTELACVANHVQTNGEYSELTGTQATTEDVLDAMEKHDWVHLACHAHQNIEDPTKSGFFLHDGTLDLAAISRRPFKNKGLAFLSACQTATGDEKLPDEAVHLASGMLMAGYPSVIATMWSVMDDDAPFVADRVYARLMQEGRVGNGEAGRALHDAVAGLRDKVGEKEFTRWAPYIHMGS